jgi:predicted amidohydrolase
MNKQTWMLILLVLVLMFSGGTLQAAEPAEDDVPNFLVAGMRVLPKRWDKAHNFELLKKYACDAASKGAKLVVTCEGFLDGYTSNLKLTGEISREKYLESCEPADGPWMKKIAALADELDIYLSVGFAEIRDQKAYNSLVVYSPAGETVLHYSKWHTKGETYTTPGNRLPVVHTDVGTLGALICYDRRFPEIPHILALKGADILIVPAYGTDGERNEALLRTRAWENSVWVVYVKQNQALIINPSGKIIARDRGDKDQLVMARIELNDDVGTGDILERRAPELYREIIELQRQPNE